MSKRRFYTSLNALLKRKKMIKAVSRALSLDSLVYGYNDFLNYVENVFHTSPRFSRIRRRKVAKKEPSYSIYLYESIIIQ